MKKKCKTSVSMFIKIPYPTDRQSNSDTKYTKVLGKIKSTSRIPQELSLSNIIYRKVF
ncbi:MAG: hypothetical protein P1P64_03960 [Treponemataceae bacterium]